MILALLSQPSSPNALIVISRVLSEVAATKPKVGYIASAPDPKREYFSQTQQLYRKLNVQMSVYLELESEFTQTALNALLDCDVIHLSGGDTQRFLQAVKQRKLIAVFQAFVENGGAIVGVSAGAMLLTPSIASAALCGDKVTDQQSALSALNLVDFQFVPHVTQDQLIDSEFQQQLNLLKSRTYLCADNDALLQVGKNLLVYGAPSLIENPPR